uniref:Elongation of very long chain fatty acids protein n=1 Tax=Anopheles epiroticus TaxID=199890 RepID=A0A182PLE4_9DIPT
MHHYMDKYGDPRTKDWPLMSSPLPTLALCLGYVYLVKVLGPRLMENRKPFQLKNTLIVYNFVQVVFSAWLFYECLMGGWWGEYSFRCQPVDHGTTGRAMRIGVSGWLTGHYNFRCQPVDYSNHPKTLRFFFVMRKKSSQVSTLHVIHHGCMPMSVWFGVKFTPGGHSTFFGLLNTFVHIVMYTYYLFTALGPQFQKYLWWKKYLTALQMVQFVLIMVHAFQLLFIDCNYPKAFVWWIGMHAVMFFFLFNEFYQNTYKVQKQKRDAAAAAKKREAELLLQQQNGHIANGSANGTLSNGTGNKAADYYVRGDVPAEMELTQRSATTNARTTAQ